MFTNGWFLGSLGFVILILIGLTLLFLKQKKTIQFYVALITFLIITAIFLHGVSFKLK
ncbi:hypothetical protein OQJ14_17310 [Fluoribacter dumoffii]|uniref:Uncharacterized protein n=1 Tax=Legionella steelei TaxID=947033 RepID=A0A0W0ZQW0_9GAMM|nr:MULTISPECIES: hypothetical protein [Legionellaceae]KTD71596.1 hypothetical protein Lste_0171 [Legionella steelei]MCW8485117.1 hypothetical protein [Fluoribacter dumoffii]